MSAPSLALYLAVTLCILRAAKLGPGAPAPGDLAWAALLGGLSSAAAGAAQPVLLFLAALALGALLSALLLDGVMWGAFTVELGPRGFGDVVLSVLLRELGELGWARRFVRRHATLLLLPPAALALLGGAALSGSAGLLLHASAALMLIAALARSAAGGGALPWLCLLAASALGGVDSLRRPGSALWMSAAAALFLILTRRWRGRGPLRPSLPGDFLCARPRPRRPGFRPRPEHAPLLSLAPRSPERSARFGHLARADVVLLSLESLSSAHLAPRLAGGAEMPCLERMIDRGLSSALHLSPSPTTNHAHQVLYGASYLGGPSTVRALAAAGYATAYLSTAATAYYGLRSLLDRTGFELVLDRRSLAGRSDHALYREGPQLLAERWGARRPRFLHVQTLDTHVPYVLHRPPRRDPADDHGRYLDALEEADQVVERLLEALVALGVVQDPLVVLTGDHGQSFGALGYLTHGSAVTAEQIEVPLSFHHSALAPGRVPWSSHLDVMPTVLDLLGIEVPPCFGAPLAESRGAPHLVTWAGHPSRTTTSCIGALSGGDKYMLDQVRDRVWHMGLRDEGARELDGAERRYAEGLLYSAFARLELR